MNQTCLEDYRWLIGPDGCQWYARVAEDERSEVAVAAALRRELSAQRTHLVLELVELRRRGRTKFADADRMFFTRLGLEQATDEVVARYKAARFSGSAVVVDLCCGLGGDLMALARRGPVLGVDRDRIHALLARANVGLVANDSAATVVAGDATQFAWDAECSWHIDPDRRAERRRTTRVDRHEPNRESLDTMLDRAPHAAIKLAPAADVPRAWQARAELEWIGRQRQCRQLVAWFGRLARDSGKRRATILHDNTPDAEPEIFSVCGAPGRPPSSRGRVRRFVFEPDPAVLAADLTGVLAEGHVLETLTGGGGCLTADHVIDSPAMACFEVLDTLAFDKRRVKRLLAERGMGRLEVKSRGVPIRPDAVRRELRVPGDQSGVLLLVRQAESVTAIVARRVD
ncbi:MAG: hypothetical protein JW888_14095 [Pirellulales bacterium]|nr:hypothetical protein [Pirellulales bacterium]